MAAQEQRSGDLLRLWDYLNVSSSFLHLSHFTNPTLLHTHVCDFNSNPSHLSGNRIILQEKVDSVRERHSCLQFIPPFTLLRSDLLTTQDD